MATDGSSNYTHACGRDNARQDTKASTGLPPSVLGDLEEQYWSHIQIGAKVENFIHDPALLERPGSHPGLFSDHGVTHVRDISRIAGELVDRNDGVLIAVRSPDRLQFIGTITQGMTYLHDIGMAAPTLKARRVHPQYAAQVALSREFGEHVDAMWNQLPGVRDRAGPRRRRYRWPGSPIASA